MIKQILIASALMTGTAAATCGPQLTLNAEQNDREYARSHASHGFGEETPYGATVDDTDYINFGIRLTVPLGEDHCEEQELAKLNRDKEYAIRAHLDNIEKQLRLCKQYGSNHPLLKGQCE